MKIERLKLRVINFDKTEEEKEFDISTSLVALNKKMLFDQLGDKAERIIVEIPDVTVAYPVYDGKTGITRIEEKVLTVTITRGPDQWGLWDTIIC